MTGLLMLGLAGLASVLVPMAWGQILLLDVANTPPFLSPIPPLTTDLDKPTNPIPITVGDKETPANDLSLFAVSSNPDLVNTDSFFFDGSGSDRTLVIRPVPGQTGLTTITVIVSDAAGLSAERRFQLAVVRDNSPPVITPVPPIFTDVGKPSNPVNFSIFDLETPSSELAVFASSSNPSLVPDSTGVLILGTGASRTLVVTPVPGQTGLAEITLTVVDLGGAIAGTIFPVTVGIVNTPPFITPIASTVTRVGTATTQLPFAVLDAESTSSELVITARSLSPSLIPNSALTITTLGEARFISARPAPDQTGSAVIVVTVTDPLGAFAETQFEVIVVPATLPLTIVRQPADEVRIPIGGEAVFRVLAAGQGTLRYRWRHNGELLPLLTAQENVLRVPDVSPARSGLYDVIVFDDTGFVLSQRARLTLDVPEGPFNDNFAASASQPVKESSGIVRFNNNSATREPGEPLHDGKTGRHSVWLSWTAPPVPGVLRLETVGSAFDTLLAVYRGPVVNNLLRVASDDDSGGSATSRLQFRTQPDVTYHFAVDGRLNASGPLLLSWFFTPGEIDAPVILDHPKSVAAQAGQDVALLTTYNPANAAVQWFFNGNPIPGGESVASSPTSPPGNRLTLVNVTAATAGAYRARIRVTGPTGQNFDVFTQPAKVQINSLAGVAQADVFTEDKYLELIDPVTFATAPRQLLSTGGRSRPLNAPARGFSGTQLFSNVGSTAEPGEPVHCGVPGGVSEWYAILAEANGLLTIDTLGSSFDTVIAVYTDPDDTGTLEGLVPVACNNDISFPAILQSATSFACTAGTIYYVAIDGVGGATGAAVLNYNLNRAPEISPIANLTLDEDTSSPVIPFLLNDAETPASSLVVVRETSNSEVLPLSGIVLGGSGTNRTVRITPAPNKNGMVQVTIKATDAGLVTTTRTFQVTINPVNDLPTLAVTFSQLTTRSSASASIVFNIGDVESAPGELTVETSSANTTLIPNANLLMGGADATRTLTIFPVFGLTGTSDITITVRDPDGGSTSQIFVVTVIPNNQPPVANPQSLSVIEGIPMVITLNGGDPEGQPITYAIMTTPAKGVLTGTPPNLTFTAGAGTSGGDAFTFKVNDGTLDSAPATVNLNIDPFPAIRISAVERVGGSVRLTITALPGQSYVVESSVNLATWSTAATLVNTTGTMTHTEALTDTARAYRVRLLVP